MTPRSQQNATLRRASLRNPWVAIGLLLVPLLIAGAFLAGSWGQGSRMGKVQAAIVNQDEMVTVNGQAVPMGRQLAVALAEREDDNISWVLTDAPGGAKGLESGEYAAVVTIPKNFSKAATSYGGAADQAEQATIQVQTSPSAAVADAALARQIAQLATQELSGMLTQTYLENVYIGFNQSGEQFTTLATAANQLASGASELATGAGTASEGTAELGQGLKALGAGAAQFKQGTPQLLEGADALIGSEAELTSGGTQLAAGGVGLATGANQLASGQQQLATGASELASGVKEYTDGTAQVIGGLSGLNSGIQTLNTQVQAGSDLTELETQLAQLKTGSSGVATGSTGVANGIKSSTAGATSLANGANGIATGVTGLSQGATALQTGLQTYQATLGRLAQGSPPPLSPVPGANEVEQGCLAQGQPAELCTQLRAVYVQGFNGGASHGWKAGLGAAEQGLTGAGDPSKSLINAAGGLATGAQRLSSSTQEWATGAQQWGTGVTRLSAAADQVATGATQLDAGVGQLQTELPAELKAQQEQLAAGVQKLATGSQTLTTRSTPLLAGGTKLATGATELAQGLNQASTGASELASGVSQYTSGVSSYAAGVNQYATGVTQFAQGTKTYAMGGVELADGMIRIADESPALVQGISQLSTGASKLAEGTQAFAKGIEEGADKVPSYSSSERQKLSQVVAKPVQAPEKGVIGSAMVPLALLVMVLGSWLGAMALHLVVRPVPREVLGSSAPTWQLAARTLLPSFGLATVWAALLTLIGGLAMDVSVGTGFALFAVMVVITLAFVTVNHALAAWLPGAGRLLAVVWAAAAVAVGTTAAVPGLFETVHAMGPLKPALDALRAVVVDTSPVSGVTVLMAWFVAALVASVLAFGRARQLSVKQYRKALATAA
ncbi:YhgE/Pip domain-containing protein [Aestuariimicrobium ganziense]|uniref:YhgE/Pip domain-containing protein n=1 Tax=Aestuariimicrobium ganziense TaxID=2773677 RepID=UPI0019406941|nr:YhgE/Pip domain-containing protein [Aestuariimicrobium ganziense]